MAYFEHIAVWVDDLEKERDFFMKYFGMECNHIYENKKNQYEAYFLNFPGSRTRLELMRQPGHEEPAARNMMKGWAHICITIGDQEKVLDLTERLKKDGHIIQSGPRWTGDGYYECVVRDPEGNFVEFSAEAQ